MRIQRTAILLALALSTVPACRSESMVRRKHDRAADKAPLLVQATSNRPLPPTDSPVAEPAEEDADTIVQVSADAPSDTIQPSGLQQAIAPYRVQDAIETALAQNPDLIALRQNENVSSAALGVAQTYPFNPFLQAQATPYQYAPNSDTINQGSATTYHYILLMQQLQLGGQQQFREDAASAALNSVRWNILQAELLNVAQTERLYFTAVYLQGLRDLANLNAQNNLQLLSILERQLEAGQATPVDVAIVRLDSRSTRQQLRVADANFQTAVLDLKRQMRLSADAPLSIDPDVIRWKWNPTTTFQLTSLAENRPDVLAARADATAAHANTNLANGSRIPDLQIGPYYQRTDTGITYVGFRGQIDLPVINNGMPLVRQRQAEYCQRTMVFQQLATRARLEAEAAANRYQRALQLRDDSDGDLEQLIPLALQRLEEQFLANEVDVLRILQARNSLLQSQRADLDTLNEVMQSAVAVTAASGLPLESLASTTAAASDNR